MEEMGRWEQDSLSIKRRHRRELQIRSSTERFHAKNIRSQNDKVGFSPPRPVDNNSPAPARQTNESPSIFYAPGSASSADFGLPDLFLCPFASVGKPRSIGSCPKSWK